MRSFALISLAYLLFLLGTVSAWPFGSNMAQGGLVKRAETTAAESATTGAAPTTGTTATKTDSAKDSKTTGTATDKETGKETGTRTGKETGKSSKTHEATETSIDPRLPAGGISMMTPSLGATTYFKVGDFVTFAWNYTSLVVTPSAVNVIASCSLNSATYTISSNMSVQETGKVIWDTEKYQANATIPLLTATYTLIVYDANKSIGDTAPAGHLSSQNNQFNFGMYLRQSYTPLGDWYCSTCSGALSDAERQALKFAVGMAVITVASFTWFAGGVGVFST
ncbi:hypothetical protein FE257_001794 [Aspergillus nanangensis]|uniref:DUF7137 domain-containing protein n=1 Tax=Aspergillus nanangensis TaxID=2582783 RepID=A0AAD4CDC8_ASPNN|nr:hypothetical protein FE257_001794 [Aspergillus nanangensis]